MYDPELRAAQDPCKLEKVYRSPMLPKMHICYVMEVSRVYGQDGKTIAFGGGRGNQLCLVVLYQEADLKGRVARPKVFLVRESSISGMLEEFSKQFKTNFSEEQIMKPDQAGDIEGEIEGKVGALVAEGGAVEDIARDLSAEIAS